VSTKDASAAQILPYFTINQGEKTMNEQPIY